MKCFIQAEHTAKTHEYEQNFETTCNKYEKRELYTPDCAFVEIELQRLEKCSEKQLLTLK